MMKHAALITILLTLVSCSGTTPQTPDNQNPSNQEPQKDNLKAILPEDRIDVTYPTLVNLGGSGKIRIFDAADDSEADCIDLSDIAACTLRSDGQLVPSSQITADTKFNTAMDALGPVSGRWRLVHCTPVRTTGRTLQIFPHCGALQYGKEYYLTVDASCVKGCDPVKKGDCRFKTKAAPEASDVLTVGSSSSAQFHTIQAAINYAAAAGVVNKVTIELENGTYPELLFLRSFADITIRGASRERTIIACANAEALVNGSGSSVKAVPSNGSAIATPGGRSVILMESCKKVRFENLTIRNSYGKDGQAETIYHNSDTGLLVMENCSLFSLQDTFLTKGYAWLHGCLVEGYTDYIWGYPQVCLLEDCEIRTAAGKSKSYIVQARCQEKSAKGFVFLGCHLTSSGAADGSMYLARSAGDSGLYDNVSFINCTMDAVVNAEGWYLDSKTVNNEKVMIYPNPNPATASAGWKEYGTKVSDGSPADLSKRSGMGKVLSESEAERYSTRAKLFAGVEVAADIL